MAFSRNYLTTLGNSMINNYRPISRSFFMPHNHFKNSDRVYIDFRRCNSIYKAMTHSISIVLNLECLSHRFYSARLSCPRWHMSAKKVQLSKRCYCPWSLTNVILLCCCKCALANWFNVIRNRERIYEKYGRVHGVLCLGRYKFICQTQAREGCTNRGYANQQN